MKDAFDDDIMNNKMQTLTEIEDLIYVMINNPKNNEEDLSLSVDPAASYQSLSDKIREMIRHDRGFSLMNSSNSGGIPSPIRESESFKKLIEFKDNSEVSNFNSGKVKKIEFSDTMNKENDKKNKKKSEKVKGEINFTHSSIDRMIFEGTDGFDQSRDIKNFGNSISETVKISNNKPKIDPFHETSSPEISADLDPSFENPGEMIHEIKKYSLRSSIDEKFYGLMNEKEIERADLNIPSLNTSLMDYPNTKIQNQRQIIENSHIHHQDSTTHKENSNLKMKKNLEKANERKATK